MPRIVIGVVLVVLGVVLALVGQPLLEADLHPVSSGLVVIGLVALGVGVAERRLPPARNEPARYWGERVR